MQTGCWNVVLVSSDKGTHDLKRAAADPKIARHPSPSLSQNTSTPPRLGAGLLGGATIVAFRGSGCHQGPSFSF
jgi:hypothetical protein